MEASEGLRSASPAGGYSAASARPTAPAPVDAPALGYDGGMRPGIDISAVLLLIAGGAAVAVGFALVALLASRLQHRFIVRPLARRLGMKPVCRRCERPMDAAAETCENCGAKVPPTGALRKLFFPE